MDHKVGRVREPGRTDAAVDARMAAAFGRADENRALAGEAHKLTTPETAVAFRCECMHPLCSEFVVLTLEEYEIETAGLWRAVVAASHADVDERTVVKRTSRFAVVEEGSFAHD